MPYVKIEITREGVTRAQKQALIKGVTGLMSDVLNSNFINGAIINVDGGLGAGRNLN